MLRALMVALLLAPPLARAVESGQPAPAFELAADKGPVRLADYQGKLLYLDFWASWCAPCRQSFPWLNEMLARYQGNGLRVLGVNLDKKPADAARFLDKVPARFDIAYDPGGAAARAYAVKAMPSSYLVAPNGQVIEVHRGFAEEDKARLERRIREALKLP